MGYLRVGKKNWKIKSYIQLGSNKTELELIFKMVTSTIYLIYSTFLVKIWFDYFTHALYSFLTEPLNNKALNPIETARQRDRGKIVLCIIRSII